MNTRFDLVAGPASEPITVAEAKAHAKIEHSAEDALITRLITAARQRVEKATGRALITQEWSATLPRWPAVLDGERHRRIRLANFPIDSVDAVIVDDVAIAASFYRLDGRDLLVSIDVTDSEGEIDDTGVVIEFTAGYGAAADVPEDLRLAVKMLAAHLYEARGATSPQGIYHQLIPEGVQALLQPYIVLEI